VSDDARKAGRAAGEGQEPGPSGEGGDLQDAPLLDDVLPWSVAPMRFGREWVLGPDAASLRRRWARLTASQDEEERSGLFRPSRARTLHTAVPPLPGHPAHGARLARERGPCPEPVRIAHGPHDQQWLIPDHRLIDAARPELWRVADERQTHLLEEVLDRRQPRQPGAGQVPGAGLSFSALLPDGHSPAGRPGRIRPLYRRPGGREPNLAPGLLRLLRRRLGLSVAPEDVLAWTAAVARPGPHGRAVPLTADPQLWERGVALGRRSVWLHTRGARGGAGDAGAGEEAGAAPRLPGGQRPYVRAPLPADPAADALGYDPEERALLIGEGRVSPVDPAAWEFEVGGAGVVESWFAKRAGGGGAGGAALGALAALGLESWRPEWTSQLLELLTVLTLLAQLRPGQRELARLLARDGRRIGARELRSSGVLPVPGFARRPASVLDLREEGPDGQLALL
jgi:hypothetical protein